MVLPLEGFADVPFAAESSAVDLVAPLIAVSLFGAVGAALFKSSDDDEPGLSVTSNSGKDDDDGTARTHFGWLHADLRVPLPPIDELRHACHLIGEHESHQMFLCGTSKPAEGNIDSCEASHDFTKYYGETIYLCRGPKIVRSTVPGC
jgi:hypothetical protein